MDGWTEPNSAFQLMLGHARKKSWHNQGWTTDLHAKKEKKSGGRSRARSLAPEKRTESPASALLQPLPRNGELNKV